VSVAPLVLCYHAVSDEWPHDLAVGPSTLERQLSRLLARGFRPVRAPEALSGSSRLLHVTFDDALTSVVRAVPILERLGIHATVFACSGLAGEGRRLEIPELAEDAAGYPHELATMTWDGLRDLAERGLEIGSHTVTHPHLPRLSDDELRRELVESRERVESELRRACGLFAYPFGDHDGRVRAAARAAGYHAAFALTTGADPADRYAVPRFGIWRKDTPVRVALKTSPLVRRARGLVH
jgi:peptidoglycan/xylan/chitin deacetylase (PgdA/CDA1 family)